jgi:protein-tyrosine-phosphatase
LNVSSVALICTANRCRSVMAHAIFVAEANRRSLPVKVYSAGVFDFRGSPPIDDTTATCADHSTPAPDEIATWARDLPLDSITRFLVMERMHAEMLVERFGVARSRVSLLGEFDPLKRGSEIADPFSRGRLVYEECYNQLRDCIVNYLDTMAELRMENALG